MVVPFDGIPGLVAHELKHGYQFEIGEFSSGLTYGAGYLYDIEDEYEAFHRQAHFNGGYFSREAIKGIEAYDSLPERNPFSKQSIMAQGPEKIAKQYKMAFRINGKTYRY
jgi:hypothetical protein